MPLVAHNASLAPVLPGIPTVNTPTTTPPTIPENDTLPDPTGQISSYQFTGPTTTSSNAFFSSAITANGRSCFTCHQPQNGWSITPSTILTQLLTTLGNTALFQPIDSANCPDAPGATASPLSLAFANARGQLLKHGNFRISINAPNPLGPPGSKTFNGRSPQWVMTVKSDPTNCELDKTYGLPAGLAGLYRRPLASTGQLLDNPGNGPLTGFNTMWDAREPNLLQQFIDATEFHGQTTTPPTQTEITQGVLFQQGIFTAQSFDNTALDLTGGDGSGALGGPENLYESRLDPTVDEPQFLVAAGPDGGCAITGKTFAELSDVPSWTAGSYSAGNFVLDTNGNLEAASTGGNTGGSEPSPWPLTIGSPTHDGSVVWTLVEVEDVCPALHPKEAPTAAPNLAPQPGHTTLATTTDLGFVLYGPSGPATFTNAGETSREAAQRASIARGELIFDQTQFTISDTAPTGAPNGTGKTCSSCHNGANTGSDAFFTPKETGVGETTTAVPACTPALISAGTPCTTLPPTSDFPLFAFYCPTGTIPFPSKASVSAPNCKLLPGNPSTCDEFDTEDPGVGLITGSCADLGEFKVPVLRGLAARAPYFHGGQATSLLALVQFYNARFNIGLNSSQEQDLVNFLNAL